MRTFIFLFLFVLTAVTCFADDYKPLPNGNVEVSAEKFKAYMKDLSRLDESEKAKELMFEDIEILEVTIAKHKQIEELNERIIERLEKIESKYEKFSEIESKTIAALIRDREIAESKGAKDTIGKYSDLTIDTAIGCATGTVFPVVGTAVGCAFGFIKGIAKSFLKN